MTSPCLLTCHIIITSLAVQIHFVEERKHRMTSSYRDGQVKIYDSSFNGRTPPSHEIQLGHLYQPGVKDSTFHHVVTVQPVQQQRGKVDCGLFSIALAYSAANGEDVSKLQLDQDQLRTHLTLCFEQQELTAFPPAQSASYAAV